MKKWIVGVVLIVASYLGYLFLSDSRISYFEEKSGVDIPLGISNVEQLTEFEFAYTIHLTLPSSKVERFVEDSDMSNEPPENWRKTFRVELMPSPWNQMPEAGEYLFATGAGEDTAWDMTLEKNTNSLWISMYQADYSGDLPPRATGRK